LRHLQQPVIFDSARRRGPDRAKRPLEEYFQVARGWVLAIIAVGTLRLVLTLQGLPNNQVKLASMTGVMSLAAAHLAILCARRGWSYRDLFVLSYFLTLPYLLVEIAGLSLAALTREPNIFHAREYSFGTPLWLHLTGHILGAFTWEAWIIWLVGCLVCWLTAKVEGKASLKAS